jgi:hypothetical protein
VGQLSTPYFACSRDTDIYIRQEIYIKVDVAQACSLLRIDLEARRLLNRRLFLATYNN